MPPLRRPVLLLLLCAPTSHALELRPTTLELAPGQVQTELWLVNDHHNAWEGRLRVYRWDQDNGVDRLQATDTLIASPTHALLPPGTRQKVRLVMTAPPPAGRPIEQAFRVLIEPAAPGLARYSLPLFVSTARSAPGALSARLERTGNASCLALHNAGPRRTRLQDLAYLDCDGNQQVLLPGLAGYVLAGATVCWALPAEVAAQPGVRFLARRDGGSTGTLSPIAATAAAGL
ncbi:fimbrial biogenesis chaperone [Xanthomonas sp. 60]